MNGKLNVASASVTLITSMLGAGINFMPSAFESIGYGNALILMAVITSLTFFTLYAIAYAASQHEANKNTSYSDIGYEISYTLGVLIDLSILLALCLVSLAYFNYIVQMAVLFFTGLKYGDDNFSYYKILFMTGIMIVFYLLSLQKDLKSLRFTSYACVGSVFYLIILLIVLNCFVGDNISKGSFKAFSSNYSIGLPLFLLAFSCQVNMVRVYNVMESKTTKCVLLVSFFSAIGGGAIYFVVGFLGYKLFGEKANGLDMVNIFCDKNSILSTYLSKNHSFIKYLPSVAVIGAMIVLTGSFPLQVNPAASIFVKLIGTKNSGDKLRISVVTIFCLSIYMINLYPELSLKLMLGIVGAIFNNMLCFLFPGIYYLLTCKSFGPLSVVSVFIMIASVAAGLYILYNIFVSSKK